MAKVAIGGTPVHPLLSLPLASFAVAGICDLVALTTGQRSWSRSAYNLLLFGVLGSLAGAIPALVDYQAVRPETPARRAAFIHAVLSAVLLGAATASTLLRRENPERPNLVAQLISILSLPAWLYSAQQGADFVARYRLDLPEEAKR